MPGDLAVTTIGAPNNCISSLWEILGSWSKTEGDCQDGTHNLHCLRAAPESASCVGDLTPAPRARAPGQAKKPPSQRDWGMRGWAASVHCPHSPQAGCFPRTGSLICHNPVGSMNASTPPPVHQSQVVKGHPLGSNCKPGALDAKAKAGAKWKAPLQETPAPWSTAAEKPRGSACPPRSLQRATVSPWMCA